MIHDTSTLSGDHIRTADVVVIGSGPGGATVAKELSARGLKVIVLESGPLFDYKRSTREAGEFLSRYVQEASMRSTIGNVSVAMMQGEMVGGTSEINSAIFKPLPDKILREWIEDYALEDLSLEEMHEHFRYLEQDMGARDTELGSQGPKNLLVKRGFDRLGWDSHPLRRVVQGCEGAGDCLTGCPSGAKKTMGATYIPQASENGADIYPLCRVKEIIIEKRRATGVLAEIVDPKTKRVKGTMLVHAKTVVCSAGVIWSPLLLRRSGVKGNGWVGRNLRMHIGVAILARFKEEVGGWYGATQGWGSNALFHRGLVMETIWVPPAVFSARLPGVGHDYLERLKNYKHYTSIATKPKGCSTGRVIELGGGPFLYMNVRKEDVADTAMGVKASIDALFAAGATEVYPGVYGVPWVLKDPKEAEILLTKKFKANHFEYVGNHVFGTCRMGGDPKQSVVDSFCESHEVRDLYVCDSSVFPTGTVNNPQQTIMAFSRRAAIAIADRHGAHTAAAMTPAYAYRRAS